MVKPTLLKWVDDWYRAIAADLINQEVELTPLELHRHVQEYILEVLCAETYEKHGVSLPEFLPGRKLAHLTCSPLIPCLSANRLGEIYEQILSQSPTEKKTGGGLITRHLSL